MLVNFDLFAGARIARHSTFALLRPKTAEAPDFNVLTFLQGFDDCLNETVDDSFGLDLCQAGPGGDMINDICFSQWNSPSVVPQNPSTNRRE